MYTFCVDIVKRGVLILIVAIENLLLLLLSLLLL